MIDTCVLYPTVMREMVLGAARAGLLVPLWSERILEEWRLAAAKLGALGVAQAEAELALLRRDWPKAICPPASGLESRLYLPDANDLHVLAIAINASADAIMTLNAKDFPRDVLAEEGLERVEPDTFLAGLHARHPEIMAEVAEKVLAEARRLSGADWQLRPLLKKARLPRLAKALTR
ncbi:RSP_2648 family PIN domain-containing protein [Sulfitobacter aestuarii]|uniref:RSP_2648 family PIN domain-containing protein n=1 Tax=Sulfitobacter aestuarii TaxID=2161676 RepID=A0ABW5U0I9_9RHOB